MYHWHLLLPPAMAQPTEIITPPKATFCRAFSQVQNRNCTWPRVKQVDIHDTDTVPILRLAPIPTHLVLDRFKMDLEIITVYMRVDNSNLAGPPRENLLAFLRALSTKHREGDTEKPFGDMAMFVGAPSPQGATWATTSTNEWR